MRLILVLIIFGVLTCTQRNLDIHLPGCMINIRTLVSHDLFAQVPVMFIFLQHKQFLKAQEKRDRCGLLWVSPYQTPIVWVGKPASCNPVRHRLKEVIILTLSPFLSSDDSQLFHKNSSSTSLQDNDALDGTAVMSVLLKCHLAEAVGSPLTVPVSCLLSQNRNILVPEVNM